MAVLTDEELVQRCQRELPHTTRSYEELVTRYAPRVYSMVYRLVGNREEAEDVAQDVLLKVYHGLPKFDQRASFSTWLYRIATNSALDALERAKRHRSHTLRFDARPDNDHAAHEDGALTALPSPGTNPEELALRRELRDCINHVLQQLDREQARVLLLRDFEGLSYDDIAGLLQAGLSAAKMRIHRARLAFRDLFDRFCGQTYLAITSSPLAGEKGKAATKE